MDTQKLTPNKAVSSFCSVGDYVKSILSAFLTDSVRRRKKETYYDTYHFLRIRYVPGILPGTLQSLSQAILRTPWGGKCYIAN